MNWIMHHFFVKGQDIKPDSGRAQDSVPQGLPPLARSRVGDGRRALRHFLDRGDLTPIIIWR
jgi:hypothetical protein